MNPRRARVKFWTPVILTTALWLGGCSCAGSVQPLESDEPLAMTPDLSGNWESANGDGNEKASFLVQKTGEGEYSARSLNESEKLQVVYQLSLVQVGSYTFLDAAFQKVKSDQGEQNEYELAVLPIHFIGRIWIDGNTLRLGLLDYEWMNKMASAGRLTVPFIERHDRDEDLIFLTAGADDLKSFVRQYAEDPQAFSSVLTFRRATSTEETSSGLQH